MASAFSTNPTSIFSWRRRFSLVHWRFGFGFRRFGFGLIDHGQDFGFVQSSSAFGHKLFFMGARWRQGGFQIRIHRICRRIAIVGVFGRGF
jgi:hypothetical protein